jgi:hypothetical protein
MGKLSWKILFIFLEINCLKKLKINLKRIVSCKYGNWDIGLLMKVKIMTLVKMNLLLIRRMKILIMMKRREKVRMKKKIQLIR